jgi:hypothetical protein
MKNTIEKVAALSLAITMEELREIRLEKMCLDTHFVIVANKGIFYTPEGMEVLRKTLREAKSTGKAPEPPLSGDSEKKTGAGSGTAVAALETVEECPVTLRVSKLCPNPTWVYARRAVKGSKEVIGPVVLCRVRTSKMMNPGTVLAICERQADGRYKHLHC